MEANRALGILSRARCMLCASMKPGSSSVALARLKRAIERLVVHPISNLIATDQFRGGDWIRIDHTSARRRCLSIENGEHLPVFEMAKWAERPETFVDTAPALAVRGEAGKVQAVLSC